MKPHATVGRRNPQLDLMRILFATLVLLSHAPELTDGDAYRELFYRMFQSGLTFGGFAVDGFFLLSGYLIAQSWQRDPELLNFLRKRSLRIIPGYLVAVVVSTVAVGLLAPGVPRWFQHFDFKFPLSALLLMAPHTPAVVPGIKNGMVNGSLWTIAYEFRCYLLLALAGMCGLLRRRTLWLALTIVLWATWLLVPGLAEIKGHLALFSLVGAPLQAVRLAAVFAIGTSFFLFRAEIKFRVWIAVLLLVAVLPALHHRVFEAVMVPCLGYLLFYLKEARIPWLERLGHFPDISYGLYLYGWPVEIVWIWYFHGSPWVTFAVSTVLCVGLGWLSWHFVERPMLTLKRRGTTPLPPA